MMPLTLFISDLHLHPSHSATLDLFIGFLQQRALEAEALYILGDLFEVWIGDDDDEPAYLRVKKALRALTEAGTRLYVMRGNRDFLLGKKFAAQIHAHLLPDPSIIDLYGVPALLMHGDILCSADLEYQRFRRRIRSPWVRGFLSFLPLYVRREIARFLRNKSMLYNQEKNTRIMDVAEAAVLEWMRRGAVDLLIHGHTHRPAVHTFTAEGKEMRRVVLGDWHKQGSVLQCTPTGIDLLPFSQEDMRKA